MWLLRLTYGRSWQAWQPTPNQFMTSLDCRLKRAYVKTFIGSNVNNDAVSLAGVFGCPAAAEAHAR